MDPAGLPVNVRRYGTARALPETIELRAGPVSLTLENADLRGIRFGDVEIVQRLYVAVRDQNWGTVQPVFSRFTVHNRGDSFDVTFQAENKTVDVDFLWSGSISGSEDGTIVYRMDGAPRRAFLRNRIGFCVLHPMTVAGVPATVTTPTETIQGVFPEFISPHQPFMDMTSIAHPAGPAGSVTLTFEGDLFEVEDQRNWTDASFKTYGTPLRLPYPVKVNPEDRITQVITISVAGAAQVREASAGSVDLAIDFDQQTALPAIGFGSGRKPLNDVETIASLKALSPDHVLGELDLSWEPEHWQRRLTNAAGNAGAVGASLDLAVIASSDTSCWSELAGHIATQAIAVRTIYVFPAPDNPVTFPRFDLVTKAATAGSAKAAFAGTEIAISGGTRAYFTELNRGIDLIPLDDLSSVMFTLTPEVHAVDNRSVMENIAAQAVAVASARELIGDRPLIVGPITFMPPYNPNATSAPPPAGPNQLPAAVDARQLSLFGAGWTIGSLHQLSESGVDATTWYELVGWRGLIEKTEELTRRDLFPSTPGGHFPLYHVFRAIADFGPSQVATVITADPIGQEALALVAGNRMRLLVANLTNTDRTISIATGPIVDVSVSYLDEANYHQSLDQPTFLKSGSESLTVENDGIEVGLAPYAIAVIDGNRAS